MKGVANVRKRDSIAARAARTFVTLLLMVLGAKSAKRTADQIAPPGTEEQHPLLNDGQRTHVLYVEAAKLLQQAVKGREKWSIFEFREVDGQLEDFDDKDFKVKLDTAMEAIRDEERRNKCLETVKSVFKICSSFAKNFLMITTNVQ